jgi:hypothetical protein
MPHGTKSASQHAERLHRETTTCRYLLRLIVDSATLLY